MVTRKDTYMKKYILYLFPLFCLLFLFGCGSDNTYLGSEKGQSCAKQAIDTVTNYLNGSFTYERAYNTLEKLDNDMKYVSDEKDAANNPNHTADRSISIEIMGMLIDLSHDNYANDAESYEKLKTGIENLQSYIDN